MDNKNKILIDWLSYTSHIDSPASIIDMLGMSGLTFSKGRGAQGYKFKMHFDHISVHYEGADNMGVWCEMSGQGCRNFETHGSGDFQHIFDTIKDNDEQMNITRLDIAYDDFEGLLDLNRLISDVVMQNYVSPFRTWNVQLGSGGNSILLGSRSSDILIRIYDKAKERNITDGTHWVRLEIQLRRKLAKAFAYDDKPIGEKFFGVLQNYCRFIEAGTATRKENCKTADYWSEFLDDMEKITLWETPGSEYNALSLENYVFKQAGNSIFTYLECFGEDKFFEGIKKRKTSLNPRQQALIEKYKPTASDPNDDFNIEFVPTLDDALF